MNWAQVVGELGGYGAVAPLIGGLFSTLFGSVRDLIQINSELLFQAKGIENTNNAAKLNQLDQSKLGKVVVWYIVFMAIMVLAAGVWVPLIAYGGDWVGECINTIKFKDHLFDAPTISLVWYWPTEGSFLFFSWDKLKEFPVGKEDADHMIAILPSFISMAANAVGFFMMNRVRKKQF